MSGTKALAEFDSYLNDLYNKYIWDDNFEYAELINDIRIELDKFFNKYMIEGD